MKKEIMYSGVELVKYTFSPSEIKEALINYYSEQPMVGAPFINANFLWDDAEIELYEDWNGGAKGEPSWDGEGCARIKVRYELDEKK